jgi:hypothetical protein
VFTAKDAPPPLAQYVSEFRHRRVLVLGAVILDEYLLGDCGRLSPEAPVPVVRVNRTRRVLGGAGNTAANIVSLGGHATLMGLVGDDDAGAVVRRCAAEAGVELLAVGGAADEARGRRRREGRSLRSAVQTDQSEVEPRAARYTPAPAAHTSIRRTRPCRTARAEAATSVRPQVSQGMGSVRGRHSGDFPFQALQQRGGPDDVAPWRSS